MPVQLFITCLVDSLFPDAGEAVVTVLERLGEEVQFPMDQTCCGQPAFNAGYWAECRRMALHTINTLESTEGPVIIPSGSCAAMIRHGYLELFSDDPSSLARARNLAARCYELSEYIVDVLGVIDVGARFQGTIAYHPSCHLTRLLKVERQPQQLLERVRGVRLERLTKDCCGFGGVFAVDQAAISGQMLDYRLRQIEATEADWVVSCDVSCLMHLEGGLRRRGSEIRCAHLAQILAGNPGGLR
jgi:L-lactate dehydrogenase complex protein LldE